MSTRTVIEINHDYLHDLLEHPDRVQSFLLRLRGTTAAEHAPTGIRILGQRHHSETLELTIR
jgi:hypothetical protein